MSATPSPNPDRFDSLNQMELRRLIQAAFGEEGIDGFEADAGQIYSTELMRPLVCALAEEALSAGWLGKTQWEISEKLTKIKDRAWLSRARYQGRISLCLFLRLWFHPDRPKNSAVTAELLRPEMNRNAAIGIARAIVKLLPANWQLVPEFLSELNYELGCVVVDATSAWAAVGHSGNINGAVRIIREVCDGNERNVIPAWYTETQRRHTASEIARLTNDGNAAFNRLDHLSRQWRGVFLATADLMESIWSRESRDAA
jgi:hypothetical protein